VQSVHRKKMFKKLTAKKVKNPLTFSWIITVCGEKDFKAESIFIYLVIEGFKNLKQPIFNTSKKSTNL